MKVGKSIPLLGAWGKILIEKKQKQCKESIDEL